jgi:hypothetical protein
MGLLHARSDRASHMRMHEWARAALILGTPHYSPQSPPARASGSSSPSRESMPVWLYVQYRQCLDPSNFQNFYKIFCHIESLDACMEY